MTVSQETRWGIDISMAVLFAVTFVTGLVKWTLLMRTFGLTDIILPLAMMSDIHDWAGFFLGVIVAVHLFSNRAWIMATTKKILEGPGMKT